MFPSDSPAQGLGQQYLFNQNDGYYTNVAKRPCLPSYPGQLQYPFSHFPMTSQSAQFYPQNYGFPVETTIVPGLQMEDRRRKTIQVIPDYERPIWTFTGLAVLALLNSPDNTATTDELYTFVLSKFPFYINQNNASWTGAIRHNLTKKKNLFSRSSESARNGKWSLVGVEEAKKEIVIEIEKSKKNPRRGMVNQDLFDVLVGRFLSVETTALTMSPVSLNTAVSEYSPVIQPEPVTSPITLNGINFQTVSDNSLAFSSTPSPVSPDTNVPVCFEYYPFIESEPITSPIILNETNSESELGNDTEESPTVSVEHLKFDIIDEEF